jgi:hypothetical protein
MFGLKLKMKIPGLCKMFDPNFLKKPKGITGAELEYVWLINQNSIMCFFKSILKEKQK